MNSGIGIMEIAVIAAVLLLFVGPNQMATLFRTGVKLWFRGKKLVEDLREELLDIPEIRKMIEEVREDVYRIKKESSDSTELSDEKKEE